MRITSIDPDDIDKLLSHIAEQASSHRPTQRLYKQPCNKACAALHNLLVSSTPKKLHLSWKVLPNKERVKVHFEKFHAFQKQLSKKLKPLGYFLSPSSSPQNLSFEKN